MAKIHLGVGCERKSFVLEIGLARKPLSLFRHHSGVCTEKGKRIENAVHRIIIQSSRLRLEHKLACFVEVLQGKRKIAEIYVHRYIIWCEAQTLSSDFCCLLVLPLIRKHGTQIVVRCSLPWIALNLLMRCE